MNLKKNEKQHKLKQMKIFHVHVPIRFRYWFVVVFFFHIFPWWFYFNFLRQSNKIVEVHRKTPKNVPIFFFVILFR